MRAWKAAAKQAVLAWGAVLLIVGTGVSAQPSPSATPSSRPAALAPGLPPGPCMERTPEGGYVQPAKLPSLEYRCLTLRSGQRVFIGEAGTANPRTVLLVHGLGNNVHRDWIYTVPALARQFHVVAVDLPGFGASQAGAQGYSFEALGQALAEVVEQRAPGQKVHVVGHSLGGAVSLHFAHAHAARVDRLVLVDAAGILLKPVFARYIAGARLRQVGIENVDRILKAFDERINAVTRSVFLGLDDRFDFSRWLAQNPAVRYALLGRYVQVEAALGLVEQDFTTAIRETAAPTTVIWGRDDPITPVRTGYLLAARMRDARIQVLDKTGHTPMQERAEAFNRLLLDALAEPLAPRYAAGPPPPGPDEGNILCQNYTSREYTGRFDTITLENCTNVRIHGARLKQLVLRSSTVTLEDTIIESADVALSATGSEVTATGVQLRGRVAIRADSSYLDLAGTSLVATGPGVEIGAPSRLYFSVSDWHGTDYSGNAHFMWPLTPAIPTGPSSTPAPR